MDNSIIIDILEVEKGEIDEESGRQTYFVKIGEVPPRSEIGLLRCVLSYFKTEDIYDLKKGDQVELIDMGDYHSIIYENNEIYQLKKFKFHS